MVDAPAVAFIRKRGGFIIHGDLEAFREAIATAGGQAEGDGELFVRPPDGGGTKEIFSAARAAGVQVRGLIPTRRTLEDVFMDAVEDGGDDNDR